MALLVAWLLPNSAQSGIILPGFPKDGALEKGCCLESPQLGSQDCGGQWLPDLPMLGRGQQLRWGINNLPEAIPLVHARPLGRI